MSLLRMLDIRPHDVAAMKTAKDVSGLIRLLNHRDPDIQWLAADALGSLGSPAVPPLVQVLVSPAYGSKNRGCRGSRGDPGPPLGKTARLCTGA